MTYGSKTVAKGLARGILITLNGVTTRDAQRAGLGWACHGPNRRPIRKNLGPARRPVQARSVFMIDTLVSSFAEQCVLSSLTELTGAYAVWYDQRTQLEHAIFIHVVLSPG